MRIGCDVSQADSQTVSCRKGKFLYEMVFENWFFLG